MVAVVHKTHFLLKSDRTTRSTIELLVRSHERVRFVARYGGWNAPYKVGTNFRHGIAEGVGLE